MVTEGPSITIHTPPRDQVLDGYGRLTSVTIRKYSMVTENLPSPVKSGISMVTEGLLQPLSASVPTFWMVTKGLSSPFPTTVVMENLP